MNPLYEAMATSVFERMSLLAARHGAVNLGQGFPDFGWADQVLEAAATAVVEESNQYAPSRGLPALREAIADHYRRHFGSVTSADATAADMTAADITTAAQVCVTSGATEALGAAILASVSPGDEVIIFTPAYDSYAPMIRRAGGIVREVALKPPQWRIDEGDLRAAIGTRTRVMIFNNPQNPTGRLFGRDELEVVARVALEHDLIVISDEVWEHILLDDQTFTPLASLPDMARQVIKIGSAGKIFALTGWKVGWMVAPVDLAGTIARAHQFLTFCTPPNLQSAVAFGLDQGDAWIAPMQQRFARARDRMTRGLRDAGFAVLDAQATYFLCVDLAASGIALDDEAFAALAVEQAGVAVVPLSPFADQDKPSHLIRLCFGKKDETIDRGVAAMARAKALAA
ncbi:MAG: aminotransferase [Sphingomicrobium sp.]